MSQPCTIIFDGEEIRGIADEPLIDFLEGHGIALPSVCYHPSLGAIETCDACWVEVNGELKRGCALRTQEGMQISSRDPQAVAARHEGMDRLLSKHELYCTVCENNNGDCSLHNAVVEMLSLIHI